MFLAFTSALAADPRFELAWKRGEISFTVHAPAGEHVNEGAPGGFGNGIEEVRGRGSLAWARLPLLRGRQMIWAEVGLCTDTGDACRMVRATAEIDGVSGRKPMVVTQPERAPVAEGAPVRVYDFGAVWCPPCNQMRAEVLDDPARMAPFSGLELQLVDVDATDSWALKTRYHVGGYPTLVAVDGAGAEVDRYVGYDGVASLTAWFEQLSKVTPLAGLESGPPARVSAEAAGSTALRLVRGQREEAARRWLPAAGDTRDARAARLALDGTRADAAWLAANDPGSDWVVDALSVAPELWPALAPRVVTLPTGAAAAAFDTLSAHVSPEAALVAHAAAAALTARSVSGDFEASRGFIVDLADGYVALGDLPRALALLQAYAAHYPDEFTWDFAASRLLLDAKRFAEAEVAARHALALAAGDQRLRAVQRYARALDGLSRRPEAVAALRFELAAAPVPGAGVNVRTTRYRGEVEGLLKELGGP